MKFKFTGRIQYVIQDHIELIIEAPSLLDADAEFGRLAYEEAKKRALGQTANTIDVFSDDIEKVQP